MMFGKMTGLKDAAGKNVYEFDRIVREDGTKATVIYRDYPSRPETKPFALTDDEKFCPLVNFGQFNIIPNQEANQQMCRRFDYRRAK